MKFRDAEKKINKIAGKMFHSLSYEKTFYTNGDVKTECHIYVENPRGFYGGNNWQEAFAELRKAMKPKPIEEIPEE